MYDDGSLIDLVRQYSFLYDMSEKSYRNKNEKENGWRAIADILQSTDKTEECEQRWLLLRNRFCTELRKEKSIPTGSAPRHIWQMYEDMMWLKPHVIPRRTRGNVSVKRLSNVWDTMTQIEYTTENAEREEELTDSEILECDKSSQSQSSVSVVENSEEHHIQSSCSTAKGHEQKSQPSCSTANKGLEQKSQPSCSTARGLEQKSQLSSSPARRQVPELKEMRNSVKKLKKSRGETNKALGDALTGALSSFTTVLNKKDETKENKTDPDDMFGSVVAQYLKEIQDCKKKIALKAEILHLIENVM